MQLAGISTLALSVEHDTVGKYLGVTRNDLFGFYAQVTKCP